ncbi:MULTISPECIES: D-arabinono-1,4-lactone oxidase [unclassified Dietzia]|uniref:D-arabinono-1,4-lactone oxidase n=1 Tax=unclassified Dietzia TaxID=2617939 RepID=UPI000D21849D|nr:MULTISPECIES: D-arabinono-1,4-lactone oxidase [unclassified Dietzia]AVZ38176.1 oxidoreductase [Dietzia sp. JS16-p6b]QGW23149.1 putative FAD/FMN-containing dehydrogenase [Dietzia sp. DQ12-45-1b]
MTKEFVNWSGSLRFTPSDTARPSDEAAVQEVVRRTAEEGGTVRPVGSGHSSVPLMRTSDVLLTLDEMSGLVSHDTDAGRASLLPGTGIARAGELLAEHDLAMENLGDVDYQALAGAIGTGTHGTGRELGNLSQTVVGGRLVTADGEVVPFGEDAGPDHDADLLRAAQVSLGSLGVMTSLTLRLLPAYELHRLNWCTHIDWVQDNFAELTTSNRHFDFYWYPRSDEAQVRTMNLPGQEPDLTPPGDHVHEDATGVSYDIIPNSRDLRFDEMEYMLPFDEGLECFKVLRERIKERHRQKVGWRVLVRTIAPDDALISNCYQRPTMTIALLQNNELPYEEYFNDIEPILQDFGGRPHWGKKHTMRADQLRGLYPEWETFHDVRRRLDPDGVFMNDYLRSLFEGDVA